MTGTELRTQIQAMANDSTLDYGADNYLNALNFAINYVSKARIDKSDSEFIYDVNLVNGASVPDNFMGFAGNYPQVWIKDTGLGRQFFHSLSGTPAVRYYVSRPNLTAISDTIPFKTTLIEAVKLAALVYLKEQRGYDMSAEKERMAAMVA